MILNINILHQNHFGSCKGYRQTGETTYNFDTALRVHQLGLGLKIIYISEHNNPTTSYFYKQSFEDFLHDQNILDKIDIEFMSRTSFQNRQYGMNNIFIITDY